MLPMQAQVQRVLLGRAIALQHSVLRIPSPHPVPILSRYRTRDPKGSTALSTAPAAYGIYPNPVRDLLTVETGSVSAASYVLTDIQGSLVGSGSLAIGTNTLSTSALAPGVYLMKVNRDGQTQTHKVVKE